MLAFTLLLLGSAATALASPGSAIAIGDGTNHCSSPALPFCCSSEKEEERSSVYTQKCKLAGSAKVSHLRNPTIPNSSSTRQTNSSDVACDRNLSRGRNSAMLYIGFARPVGTSPYLHHVSTWVFYLDSDGVEGYEGRAANSCREWWRHFFRLREVNDMISVEEVCSMNRRIRSNHSLEANRQSAPRRVETKCATVCLVVCAL
jgi:hypothetical protein